MKKNVFLTAFFLIPLLVSAVWAANLDGVWMTIVEGPLAKQEVYMNIQGDKYTNEMNGTVTESGTFEIVSGTMRGVSANTGNFVYGFQMSADETSFTLSMPNGYEVEYKKQ